MSGDSSSASSETSSDAGDADASDADEEATLQSQAVFKGPGFLRRMLRFPEFEEAEE